MSEICWVCSKNQATLLCDYVIGFEIAGETTYQPTLRGKSGEEHPYSKPVTYSYIDAESRMFTCDRPLCESCAIGAGHRIWCGKNPGIDTIDYCPEHATAPRPDLRDKSSLLTESEAKAIQRRLLIKSV